MTYKDHLLPEKTNRFNKRQLMEVARSTMVESKARSFRLTLSTCPFSLA